MEEAARFHVLCAVFGVDGVILSTLRRSFVRAVGGVLHGALLFRRLHLTVAP